MSSVTIGDAASYDGSDIVPWTEERWLDLGETHQRIELVDGSLLVSPAPAPLQQNISSLLTEAIRPAAREVGLRVFEGINLRLRAGRIFIPDLAIVEPVDRRTVVIDATICRLVGEILSPGNPGADRVMKMHYYAEAGIPWYLLVEPDKSVTMTLYRLDGDRYIEHLGGVAGEALTLTEPVSVRLDPADLDED